jgi:hypothetical protein
MTYMSPLPVTEPVLLVLLSLAEQPRHGYSILKDVERMSCGRVMLSTGTLYGALRRLPREPPAGHKESLIKLVQLLWWCVNSRPRRGGRIFHHHHSSRTSCQFSISRR